MNKRSKTTESLSRQAHWPALMSCRKPLRHWLVWGGLPSSAWAAASETPPSLRSHGSCPCRNDWPVVEPLPSAAPAVHSDGFSAWDEMIGKMKEKVKNKKRKWKWPEISRTYKKWFMPWKTIFLSFLAQNLTLKSKWSYSFDKKNCGHHEDIYLFILWFTYTFLKETTAKKKNATNIESVTVKVFLEQKNKLLA